MQLLINNQIIRDSSGNAILTGFTKIVKTSNSIKCYLEEQIEKEFLGVKDFSIFSIEGGDFSTEIDESQTNEILLKQIAALTLENNKKDAIAKNLMKQVAEINLKIMKLEGAK